MLDKDSEQFIAWALVKLRDDQYYNDIRKEILARVEHFYAKSKDEVIKKLHEKMLLGATEHGAPIHGPEKTQKELEQEYIDLLGWLLIEKWNGEQHD